MSTHNSTGQLIAFSESRCVARGRLKQVVTHLKDYVAANPEHQLLIMDAKTSAPVEIDLRRSVDEILAARFGSETTAGQVTAMPVEGSGGKPPAGKTADGNAKKPRGRPRLGVVPREVTLLPRHWAWLADQPGGASAALRRLVEQARRASAATDAQRSARDSAYQFMTAVAGDEPGYEEAVRALFAGDLSRLQDCIGQWPADVAAHADALAQTALAAKDVETQS